MSIFEIPSRSHARTDPSTSRFSFASETASRQVTSSSHETRKRTHDNYSAPAIRGFTAQPWTSSTSTFSHSESPAPLAHDRYTLAGGGMEGKNSFTRQNGDYDDYFGLQQQRGMWSSPTSPALKPMALDGGGATTATTATANAAGPWVVNSLLNIVGGVAGKLFQFCTVPFRGFQAGGGQKYDVDAQVEIASKLGLNDEVETREIEPAAPVQQFTFGDQPSDNFGVRSLESVDFERPEFERPRPPKRLRTEDAWVMVGSEGDNELNTSPISTPTSRLSMRRFPEQRTSKATYTPSPSQIPRPLSRASAATPTARRPSLIPVSRRSNMSRTPVYSSALPGPRTHSRQSSRSHSRLSFGSSGQSSDTQTKRISPLPPDSQRLVTKLRREELEDDARMRRMSSQMSAMLREAREALGAKFEIADDERSLDDAPDW